MNTTGPLSMLYMTKQKQRCFQISDAISLHGFTDVSFRTQTAVLVHLLLVLTVPQLPCTSLLH